MRKFTKWLLLVSVLVFASVATEYPTSVYITRIGNCRFGEDNILKCSSLWKSFNPVNVTTNILFWLGISVLVILIFKIVIRQKDRKKKKKKSKN